MGILHSYCQPCKISSFEEDSIVQKKTIFRRPREVSAESKPQNCLSKTVCPYFTMSYEHKDILQKHYRQTLLEQRPDVFHKTMLMCIQSSPKLNEIIACQLYCFRDLTKWPKLNRLSQAQCSFFDRLIHELHLDSSAVSEAVYQLGIIHFRYAQYGLKPHFLDLWRQHFEVFLEKLKFENTDEKAQFIEAFRILTAFVTESMNLAYSRCQQEAAAKAREQTDASRGGSACPHAN